MKKTHIIVLVLIAVVIGLIVSMTSDYSTYETFASADQQQGEEFHVVGQLSHEDSLSYNPQKNPNYFSFYMVDKEGNKEKVVYHGAKPRDFKRSEQIVLTGEMKKNHFQANKILMKCPSKYTEDTVEVEAMQDQTVSSAQSKSKTYQ